MTTPSETTETAAPETHTPPTKRSPLKATPDELKTFGLIGVIAVLWIGATVLFGFGGLIVAALIAVAVVMSLLVIISRG